MNTPPATPARQRSARFLACVCACVVMLASAVAIGAYMSVFHVHLQKTPIYPRENRQVSSIPDLTPGWKRLGSDQIMGAEIVETLGTENYVSRNYYKLSETGDTGDTDRPSVLEFHAAYYTGMIDTVPHVPERCFVGGGLQQSETSRVMDLPMDTGSWRADPSVPERFAGLNGKIYTVRLSNDPSMTDAPGQRVRLPRGVGPENPIQIRVSEFISPGGDNIYAGYFFIANGGTKANANDVRQLAFKLDDDYAYYLKIQITGHGYASFDDFVANAGDLLSDLIGETMRCVPDWVDVQTGVYPPDNPRQPGAGALASERTD